MAFSIDKKLILAAIETQYNQTPLPTDLSWVPILANKDASATPEGERIDREVINPTFSKLPHVVGTKSTAISLNVEIKGGGLDSQTSELLVPEQDVLLRACGFKRQAGYRLTVGSVTGNFTFGEEVTIATNPAGTVINLITEASNLILWLTNANTTIAVNDEITQGTATATVTAVEKAFIYVPTSESNEHQSASLRFFYDKILIVASGVRGDVSFNFEAGKIGTASFELKGHFHDLSDLTPSRATFSKIVPPVCMGAAMQVGTLDMTTSAVSKFEVKMGNNVAMPPSITSPTGISEIIINDRKVSGSLDPEAAPLANYNPFQKWKTGALEIIHASFGDTPGNRFHIVVPKAQYTEAPKIGDREKRMTYEFAFEPKGTAGDDEVFIAFY